MSELGEFNLVIKDYPSTFAALGKRTELTPEQLVLLEKCREIVHKLAGQMYVPPFRYYRPEVGEKIIETGRNIIKGEIGSSQKLLPPHREGIDD